jgi:hypothetical protein
MTSSSFSLHKIVAVAVLVLATLPVAASATTILVPADQPTIQAAIDAASNGDTILVSGGTYIENIDFKGKAVNLKSVNGPATTIIDGGAKDTVVKFSTQETPSSTIDGFTIRNGAVNPSSTFSGSGILVGSSSPTITNNIITNNLGCQGSGIDVQFGSPLIQGNTITNNSQGGCSGGTGGGGILVGGASQPQILNNTISHNSTGVDGGGISLFAAGTPTIRGNFITANTASGAGGGIAMGNDSDALVQDNVLTGNTANQGGGIAALVPSGAVGPTLVNNTFYANSASNGGSELYLDGFYNQTPIYNNIFVGAAAQTAVFCDTQYLAQPPIFQFNDTFNPQGTPFAGTCTGETGTNGNVSVDPLFVNPGSDFHLQSTSPVIDAGSNSAPGLPKQDIASNPRVLDGNGDCVATVDMGAYEFARPSSFTLNPLSLSFPDQLVGTTSAALSSTITNNASTPSTVCSIAISGDFSQTNTCGTAIASKGSCSVDVTFTPTAHGTRSGLLQIITSDAGSPQTIVLSGKGLMPAVLLSATALNFSTQQVGTTSTSQSVSLNNTGDGPLNITNVAMTGDFSQTNTCGNTVAPGGTCSFNVMFAPMASGNRNGTLTITDNAAGSPHAVVLSGSASDFGLAAASGGSTSATVTAGSPATYNLQVTPQNGFNAGVTLSCTGAPSEATCTVSQPSVTANGSPIAFTVSVTTTAPSLVVPRAPTPRVPPLGPFTVEMLLLSVIALYLRSLNRTKAFCARRIAYLSPIFILVLSTIVIAGCGGGGSSTPKDPGTPKGAHALTVTATSNGVSHSLTLTLNVN